MSSMAEEAALARATAFVEGGVEVEEEVPPSSEGEPVVPPVEEPEPPMFEFEPEVPEDLLSELELVEDEEPEVEEEEEEQDDEYEDDPAAAKLRKKLAKAEKEAAHYRNLRVRDSRVKWEAEAKKFFPLSETVLPSIQADSRRSFLRQAQDAHNTILPFVKGVAEKAQAARENAVEEARAEARAEAELAWGKPHAASEVPVEAEDHQKQIERARKTGDLSDSIKAMIFPKRSE